MTTETTPAALRGIAAGEETLFSYAGLDSATAHVLQPASVDELRRIFAHARAAGRRVTLRGGGHSFDAQALGDDLVVSMRAFDDIDVRAAEARVTVGPGATWGAILRALTTAGLMPAVTVTTEHATAGGTLSGDCLSRFSPAYGKEGTWVESFDLLTPAGELVRCTPPAPGAAPSTLSERLFLGAVGGLGYLGAFVSITYRVLALGDPDRTRVRTRVRKYRTFAHLADALAPTVRQTVLEPSDPADEGMLDAVYSALYTGRDGREEALLLTSTLTSARRRRPLVLYRPKLVRRVVTEWLIRSEPLNRLLWWFGFRVLFRERVDHVNELEGYTFFMDGNVRSKQAARRLLGRRLKTLQQTFIVPGDPEVPADWDRARGALVAWLAHANAVLAERDLAPTLFDVLFLPRDLPFRLSATADLPGFAVSYAFETNDEGKLDRARAAFADLADTLWTEYGGRVYLVKNVCARPETLAAMYGSHAGEFLALKREVDPEGVLTNAFLERVLGRTPGAQLRVARTS
jgi:decaprenylphospho-beta-D-ribofuranose 2-oxidase